MMLDEVTPQDEEAMKFTHKKAWDLWYYDILGVQGIYITETDDFCLLVASKVRWLGGGGGGGWAAAAWRQRRWLGGSGGWAAAVAGFGTCPNHSLPLPSRTGHVLRARGSPVRRVLLWLCGEPGVGPAPAGHRALLPGGHRDAGADPEPQPSPRRCQPAVGL